MSSGNKVKGFFEEKSNLGPPPWGMRITGVGGYVPEKVVTNDELARDLKRRASEISGMPEKIREGMETSDKWIKKRTGIGERRCVTKGATTSDLAVIAAEEALETSGLNREAIDFVIFATVTPDYWFSPPTSTEFLRKLGLKGLELNDDLMPLALRKRVLGYDTASACTSFGVALEQAYALIRSGLHRKGLVIGADIVQAIANSLDRATMVLFGSGAGVFTVEAVPQGQDAFRPEWFLSGAEGRLANKLICPVGGTAKPLTLDIMQQIINRPWERPDKLYQDGRFIFDFMIRFIADIFLPEVVKKSGLNLEDIKHIFFHMANGRLVKGVEKRAKKKLREKGITYFPEVHYTIAKFANTTSATIPLGLRTVLANDWEEEIIVTSEGRDLNLTLKEGDLCLMMAFGGGLTWSSCIFEWTGVKSMPSAYLERLNQDLST